jgi:hypothetical protein
MTYREIEQDSVNLSLSSNRLVPDEHDAFGRDHDFYPWVARQGNYSGYRQSDPSQLMTKLCSRIIRQFLSFFESNEA